MCFTLMSFRLIEKEKALVGGSLFRTVLLGEHGGFGLAGVVRLFDLVQLVDDHGGNLPGHPEDDEEDQHLTDGELAEVGEGYVQEIEYGHGILLVVGFYYSLCNYCEILDKNHNPCGGHGRELGLLRDGGVHVLLELAVGTPLAEDAHTVGDHRHTRHDDEGGEGQLGVVANGEVGHSLVPDVHGTSFRFVECSHYMRGLLCEKNSYPVGWGMSLRGLLGGGGVLRVGRRLGEHLAGPLQSLELDALADGAGRLGDLEGGVTHGISPLVVGSHYRHCIFCEVNTSGANFRKNIGDV